MDLIDFEVKKLGGDSSKLFLGGFGQGATIALSAFLCYKGGALGGLTGISGCFCANIDWNEVNVEVKRKTPIGFWHDQQNWLLAPDFAKASYELMKNRQIDQYTFKVEDNHYSFLEIDTMHILSEWYGKLMKIPEQTKPAQVDSGMGLKKEKVIDIDDFLKKTFDDKAPDSDSDSD